MPQMEGCKCETEIYEWMDVRKGDPSQRSHPNNNQMEFCLLQAIEKYFWTNLNLKTK